MPDIYVELRRDNSGWVLTPAGMLRLANPEAICPGRIHIIEYEPFCRWAIIVAICIPVAPELELRHQRR